MRKLTTEEFVSKAREVHGDKYDYSKVEYVDASTKVYIICPEHGLFEQNPSSHLKGCGCPKCAVNVRSTQKKSKRISYDEAKAVVQSLGIKDSGEYKLRFEDTLKPLKLPKNPQTAYKNEGWISWAVYCGNERKSTEYLPYEEAKSYVNGLGLTSVKEWNELCKEEKIPFYIPYNPKSTYANKGWTGMEDWLGGTYKSSIITTEEFIRRAKEVHGDKYDYSKVKYVNATTKVCIICPEHGEFWQKAGSHLNGHGCRKCSNVSLSLSRRDSKDAFIEKAKSVHGDKYDYSKVEYVNSNTKVCIICPEHGEFCMAPNAHLGGQGCPKCSCSNRNLAFDEFVSKAKSVHGDKYDYSKVKYVNATTKVCIVCPEHGEFWQKPCEHLKGRGCRKCGWERLKSKAFTTEEFIAKAREVHGDKYDYSKTVYVNQNTKVCIICPEHGEFWQNAGNHLSGKGCVKCVRPNEGMTTEEFIAKAREVHGDKYDYSKTQYVNTYNDVCIICPVHGEFFQNPYNHLKGRGCPVCSNGFNKNYKFNLLQEFKDEYAFRAFLANNDVNILQVILRNVEPKYEPLREDIERALRNADEADPIEALEQKYSTESEEDANVAEMRVETPSIATIDLDDDDSVSTMLDVPEAEDRTEPSIEDVVRNNEQELQVINRIEHMLTPEDREYIMAKFLNDKRRVWMSEREN